MIVADVQSSRSVSERRKMDISLVEAQARGMARLRADSEMRFLPETLTGLRTFSKMTWRMSSSRSRKAGILGAREDVLVGV